MALHPCIERGADIVVERVGRERHDREYFGCDPEAADGLGRGVAVTFGHLHIHKDQLERRPLRLCLHHLAHGLLSVLCNCDVELEAFEHRGCKDAVDVVILGQQHSRSGEDGRAGLHRAVNGRSLASGLAVRDRLDKRQRHGEARAASRRAFRR